MGKKKYIKKEKSIQVKNNEVSLTEQLKLVPLVILTAIVPLIVYMKVIPLPEQYKPFWVRDPAIDFFSYYKVKWILVLTVILVVLSILLYLFKRIEFKKNILLLPLGILALFIILSTLLSEHPTIALNGYFDRYEGMWVLLSYLIITVATYQVIKSEKELKIVTGAVIVGAILVSLIGIFQYFDMDFFKTDFGRKFILPAQYYKIAESLKFKFSKYTIYSTLYNPNYVGSYMAMIFPMSFTLYLFARKNVTKIVFGMLTLLFFAVQIGCNSRAGIVGALGAFAVLFLLRYKDIAKKWKRVGAVVILCIAVFMGMNTYSNGRLTGKLDTLAGDVSKLANVQNEQMQENDLQMDEGTLKDSWINQAIEKYGHLGSKRGYIWLRSIEIAKQTLFLGKGPDTFLLYFPQGDPLKYKYLGNQLVDKPHNMYLQWAINIGGIALLTFLVLIGIHFYHAFKILWNSKKESWIEIAAIGFFVAWCGYLISGVFNDSIVSVAPVFWVIFGMSMAANEMLKHS